MNEKLYINLSIEGGSTMREIKDVSYSLENLKNKVKVSLFEYIE